MENLRNRRRTKFLSTPLEAAVCTLKPNYLNFQKIDDTLLSVNLTQASVFWNKPTPIGSAVLHLSKIVLYDFHYNEMKPKFGSSLTVVYEDTDPFLYRIQTDDFYSDTESFKNLLDLSDYPKTHKLYDPNNKKVALTMKDKLNGKVMLEFTCLRSKLYSIKFETGLKKSAQGIEKVSEKTLHHDLFKEILAEKQQH